jgi:hypothetical protein
MRTLELIGKVSGSVLLGGARVNGGALLYRVSNAHTRATSGYWLEKWVDGRPTIGRDYSCVDAALIAFEKDEAFFGASGEFNARGVN